MTLSIDIQRALRRAAEWHEGQLRRGSGLPFLEHVACVALTLTRASCDDDVVIAGILHDAVEDAEVSLDTIRSEFGGRVASIVDACSERKFDDRGGHRPWIDRKREHLGSLARATVDARAVVLADKLHNLRSITLDLRAGLDVWSLFHASRADVLWYYQASIDACSGDDPVLAELVTACRQALEEAKSA